MQLSNNVKSYLLTISASINSEKIGRAWISQTRWVAWGDGSSRTPSLLVLVLALCLFILKQHINIFVVLDSKSLNITFFSLTVWEVWIKIFYHPMVVFKRMSNSGGGGSSADDDDDDNELLFLIKCLIVWLGLCFIVMCFVFREKKQ